MAKPPFTMSKYASELDLQRAARKYYETRVARLESALNDLIEVAEQCDSWESFPSYAIEQASKALDA